MMDDAASRNSGIPLQDRHGLGSHNYDRTAGAGNSRFIQGNNHNHHDHSNNDSSHNNNFSVQYILHAAHLPGPQQSPAAATTSNRARHGLRVRSLNLCICFTGGFDRRTRNKILIGVLVLVMVIVLAVGLGVGLTRGHGSSTPTSSFVPRKIKSKSPLTVAGWYDQVADNFRIRLYYQDPDQLLRFSAWATNESWSGPKLSGTSHAASNSTSLALGITLENDATYKLIYVDSQFNMRAQNYDDWPNANEQGTSVVFNDGIGALSVSPSSQVAAYWPFFVSQNSNDLLQWWYRGEAPAIWTNATLDIRGSPHSEMAIVPSSAEYMDDGRLFYRSSDGNLNEAVVYNLTIQPDSQYIPIGEDASMTAFSIARDETTNLTNTYVLYQDTSSTIQVVWQDDDTGWKGPRAYGAFEGADNGTDIACLTLSTWARSGVPVRITAAYNMCRCYFQVDSLWPPPEMNTCYNVFTPTWHYTDPYSCHRCTYPVAFG